MTKKILYTFLFIIIAILAAFFIWKYIDFASDDNPDKTFLKPRVEMGVLEITSLSDEEIDMDVNLLIENQLPISFTADSLEFNIFINHVEVIKNQFVKSVKLEGNDSTWIVLPITLLVDQLSSILKESDRQGLDSVEYKIHANFFTDLLIKKNFEVDVVRFLPLIHPPELEVGSIQVGSLNFSNATLLLDVSIRNNNSYTIKLKNIDFKIAIEDHELIEGELPGLTAVKPKSVKEVQLPIEVSLKEVGKTLFDLIRKGKSIKYKLDIGFRLDSDNKSLNNTKVLLKSSGSVKSLLDLKKD